MGMIFILVGWCFSEGVGRGAMGTLGRALASARQGLLPKWHGSRLVHRSSSAFPPRRERFPRSGFSPKSLPAPRGAFSGENLCTRRDPCHFGAISLIFAGSGSLRLALRGTTNGPELFSASGPSRLASSGTVISYASPTITAKKSLGAMEHVRTPSRSLMRSILSFSAPAVSRSVEAKCESASACSAFPTSA